MHSASVRQNTSSPLDRSTANETSPSGVLISSDIRLGVCAAPRSALVPRSTPSSVVSRTAGVAAESVARESKCICTTLLVQECLARTFLGTHRSTHLHSQGIASLWARPLGFSRKHGHRSKAVISLTSVASPWQVGPAERETGAA